MLKMEAILRGGDEGKGGIGRGISIAVVIVLAVLAIVILVVMIYHPPGSILGYILYGLGVIAVFGLSIGTAFRAIHAF